MRAYVLTWNGAEDPPVRLAIPPKQPRKPETLPESLKEENETGEDLMHLDREMAQRLTLTAAFAFIHGAAMTIGSATAIAILDLLH